MIAPSECFAVHLHKLAETPPYIAPRLFINKVERQSPHLDPKWLFRECNIPHCPFSHLRSTKRWLSKHHGPLFQTHINWLSIENLNCISPSPTSVIFRSFPSFHMDRSKFLAARILICFVVRNFPMRLRENSSNAFSLFTGGIGMTSSSSVVNVIFCMRSRTSDSMAVFVAVYVSL